MNTLHEADKTLSKLLPPVEAKLGITYVPSCFSLPFEHEGKRYVFNTLTKQCVETVLPDSARAGEGYDALIRALFLVPEDKDECAYYNSISALLRAFGQTQGIQGYTILPTLGCNARCVYCYEDVVRPISMTHETASQTIRYIQDTHADDKIKLHWFGGEPLLRPDIIDQICAGVQRMGLNYHSTMTSNGSLVTPATIAKMVTDWKLDHIQISMDGAEKDYMLRKRYIQYQDYYYKVIEAVSALSEAGIIVSLRCNVDEENWSGVPQFMQDLATGVENKERVFVYFAPLYSVQAGAGNLPMREKMRNAAPLIEKAGFRTFPTGRLNLHFQVNRCMADSNCVVIAPDGSLYPCEHCPPKSRYGDIWNGVTDEAARREFCRVDQTREMCRKCPFLPMCTSFASCPIEVDHCRELAQNTVLNQLKDLVSQTVSGKEEEADTSDLLFYNC